MTDTTSPSPTRITSSITAVATATRTDIDVLSVTMRGTPSAVDETAELLRARGLQVIRRIDQHDADVIAKRDPAAEADGEAWDGEHDPAAEDAALAEMAQEG